MGKKATRKPLPGTIISKDNKPKLLSVLSSLALKKIIIFLAVVLLIGAVAVGFFILSGRDNKKIDITQEQDSIAKQLLTDLSVEKDDDKKAELSMSVAERYKVIGEYEKSKEYYLMARKHYENKKDSSALQKIDQSLSFVGHQLEVKSIQENSKTYYERANNPDKYKDIKPPETE